MNHEHAPWLEWLTIKYGLMGLFVDLGELHWTGRIDNMWPETEWFFEA